MNLIRLKRFLRPFVSPLVTALPYFLRKHVRQPGAIEITERRMLDISFFDAEKEESSVSLVSKKLKRNFLDVSPLPETFLKSFFLVVNARSIISMEQVNLIARDASTLDEKALSVCDWISLYQICCMRGLYYIGYQFREKSLAVALADNKETKRYFAACVEKSAVLGKEFESIIKEADLDEETKCKFLALCHLLDRKNFSVVSGLVDERFSKYLGNKKVVLVGPSESQSSDAEEIDSHDEVVRLNFSHSQKGCDNKFNGTKATLTYFNFEQLLAFNNGGLGRLPDGIAYACLKSQRFLDDVALKNPRVSIRPLVNFDGLFFNGSLNMGPIAMLDLALHANLPVKIYHMDLMLTVRRVQGYYPETFGRNDDETLVSVFNRSAVVHDPITQYRLLESLWKSGVILGDKRFDEVMSLGCEEYMHQLQLAYSNIN